MTRTYKGALITGASSGIGTAFAHALPTETDLLLTGRDAEALKMLQQSLASAGRRVDCIIADLAATTGVEAVSAAAEAVRH